jgi:hypothetical protein
MMELGFVRRYQFLESILMYNLGASWIDALGENAVRSRSNFELQVLFPAGEAVAMSASESERLGLIVGVETDQTADLAGGDRRLFEMPRSHTGLHANLFGVFCVGLDESIAVPPENNNKVIKSEGGRERSQFQLTLT